jgi:hypothetical protein
MPSPHSNVTDAVLTVTAELTNLGTGGACGGKRGVVGRERGVGRERERGVGRERASQYNHAHTHTHARTHTYHGQRGEGGVDRFGGPKPIKGRQAVLVTGVGFEFHVNEPPVDAVAAGTRVGRVFAEFHEFLDCSASHRASGLQQKEHHRCRVLFACGGRRMIGGWKENGRRMEGGWKEKQ